MERFHDLGPRRAILKPRWVNCYQCDRRINEMDAQKRAKGPGDEKLIWCRKCYQAEFDALPFVKRRPRREKK